MRIEARGTALVRSVTVRQLLILIRWRLEADKQMVHVIA